MSNNNMSLPAGYRIEGYQIESELGHGGFGITYKAVDLELNRLVAIKEYLPRDFAYREAGNTVRPISSSDTEVFEWGITRFLDEARTLARFHHESIVGVRRFFRANNTAYLVMDYCEGEALDTLLKRDEYLPAKVVHKMLPSLIEALDILHAGGIVHRDVKPANIYLKSNGIPVLLDFGSARQSVGGRSHTTVLSPYYAPYEQYSTTQEQGPWTDIYGLGATLYHCMTGGRPPEAIDRIQDDNYMPVEEVARDDYGIQLCDTVNKALIVSVGKRLQSAEQWREVMNGTKQVLPELKRRLIVGRSSEADIVIDDSDGTVSRVHAELIMNEDGSAYLIDKNSANGVFVLDGDEWYEVNQTELSPGMSIRLGEYLLSSDNLLEITNHNTSEKKSGVSDIPEHKIIKDEKITNYAGFWKRVGAFLIDMTIILVITFVIDFVYGAIFYDVVANDSPAIDIFAEILGVAIAWLYFSLQESSQKQATLGKLALGIKVVDLSGEKISFGRATGRHFSRILSAILLIGYIMVAFTKKKQGLHDMVASTLVINK